VRTRAKPASAAILAPAAQSYNPPVTRVSVNPGRDLKKPFVDVPADAPKVVRIGLAAFRWYLIAIFGLYLLGLVVVALLLIFRAE
jgi:hypothetical protein